MSSDKEVGVSVVPQAPQIEAVNGVTWDYFGSSFHVRPNIEIASAIMSITGFVSSIGPITEMKSFYLLTAAKRGIVVACLTFAIAFFTLPAGPLADRWSRRKVVSLGGLSYGVGMIICAFSDRLAVFILGRVIAGAGQGFFFSTAGLWQVETAPKKIRGRIGAMSQLFCPIGLVAGYFVCYGTIRLDDKWAWKIPTLIQGGLAMIMAVLVISPLVPPSPRWCVAQGQSERGFEVIISLAKTRSAAEEEWVDLSTKLEMSSGSRGRRTLGYDSVMDCFRGGRTRRTVLGVILSAMVALSGIDGVVWYAPVIFSSAGLSAQRSSFLASGVVGIVALVATLPSQFYLIDRVKRRINIVVGSGIMAICLSIVAILYAVSGGIAKQWAIIAFINISVAGCQMFFIAPIIVYSAEIQPTVTASTATALGRSVLSLCNASIALVSPKFLSASTSGFFFTFAGMNFLTLAITLVFAKETLGLSIEQIEGLW